MAKDIYHNLVKQALENEGWTITDDPIISPSDFDAEKYRLTLVQKNISWLNKGRKKYWLKLKAL